MGLLKGSWYLSKIQAILLLANKDKGKVKARSKDKWSSMIALVESQYHFLIDVNFFLICLWMR